MSLKVLEVFGPATIQDAGRPGYRKYGVPVGGAFDRESLALANGLLGNGQTAPAIELALGTASFEATGDTDVAIVGAADEVFINGASGGGNRSLALRKGDVLKIAPPKTGVRTMIALPGGIKGAPILGSLSGASVEKGDEIVAKGASARDPQALVHPPMSLTTGAFRVVPIGSADPWIERTYTASRLMNRVGIRLEGCSGLTDLATKASEPSVLGVIQLTGDGRLIIHGPDGPTIGGYLKLGCIVSEDLNRLGQVAPGDALRFVLAR